MVDVSKIALGAAARVGHSSSIVVSKSKNSAAYFINVYTEHESDVQDMATEFITKAFNVAYETGMSPAQLAEENKRLRDALQLAINQVDDLKSDIIRDIGA